MFFDEDETLVREGKDLALDARKREEEERRLCDDTVWWWRL